MSKEFWQERPKHPSSIDLDKYENFVDDLNRIYTINIKTEFEKLDFDYQNGCVISIGSDGKQERFPQSRTELIFIENIKGVFTSQNIIDEYKSKKGMEYLSKFDVGCQGIPTIKSLRDRDDIFSFNGDNRRIYPDAILNSTLIIGNPKIYYQARTKVLEEMALNDGLSGKIRKEVKGQFKRHVKSIENGEYRNVKIFNTNPPLQYYNENPEYYSVGFKIAFLRAVQRKMDLLTIDYVRSKSWEIENIATRLPVKTVDRIKYFINKGYLQDNESYVMAYMWFLKNYHTAQNTYKLNRGRDTVAISYDSKEFLHHKKYILELVNSENQSLIGLPKTRKV